MAGITQQEFAEASEISIDQIRHFERGSRPLTPHMSGYLSSRLGVSGHWLYGQGPSDDPIGLDGKPFTRETFELFRASERSGKASEDIRSLNKPRADAWILYLKDLIEKTFHAAYGEPITEYLGCSIEAEVRRILPSTIRGIPKMRFKSVDEAVVFLADRKAKGDSAKRSKRTRSGPRKRT
jgi:transcriptional regulator with XRE-family HTH domain